MYGAYQGKVKSSRGAHDSVDSSHHNPSPQSIGSPEIHCPLSQISSPLQYKPSSQSSLISHSVPIIIIIGICLTEPI